MRPTSFSVLTVCAAILWGTAPALAHVHLVSSTPATGSTVSAPTEIMMRFSGPLVSRASAIKLVDARGGVVTVGIVSSGNTAILARPGHPLATGIYRLTWTAAGENDGHRMNGNISFTVK